MSFRTPAQQCSSNRLSPAKRLSQLDKRICAKREDRAADYSGSGPQAHNNRPPGCAGSLASCMTLGPCPALPPKVPLELLWSPTPELTPLLEVVRSQVGIRTAKPEKVYSYGRFSRVGASVVDRSALGKAYFSSNVGV